MIPDLLALAYLASWPMCALWGISHPSNITGELAEKALRRLPQALSPLTLYIGVSLLCEAGGSLTLNIINLAGTKQHWLSEEIILANTISIVFIAPGALLLIRRGWARRTGIVILASMAIALMGTGVIGLITGQRLHIFNAFMIPWITSAGVYAMMAWLLWQNMGEVISNQ